MPICLCGYVSKGGHNNWSVECEPEMVKNMNKADASDSLKDSADYLKGSYACNMVFDLSRVKLAIDALDKTIDAKKKKAEEKGREKKLN